MTRTYAANARLQRRSVTFYVCVWGWPLIAAFCPWLLAKAFSAEDGLFYLPSFLAPLLVLFFLYPLQNSITNFYYATLFKWEPFAAQVASHFRGRFLLLTAFPALLILVVFLPVWCGMTYLAATTSDRVATTTILLSFLGAYVSGRCIANKFERAYRGIASSWEEELDYPDRIISAVVTTTSSSVRTANNSKLLVLQRRTAIAVGPLSGDSRERPSFDNQPRPQQRRRPRFTGKRSGHEPPHHHSNLYEPNCSPESESYSWVFQLTGWLVPTIAVAYWCLLGLTSHSAVVLLFNLWCAFVVFVPPVLHVVERYELSLRPHELAPHSARSKTRRQVLFTFFSLPAFAGCSLLGSWILPWAANAVTQSQDNFLVLITVALVMGGIVAGVANYYFAFVFTPLNIAFPDRGDRPQNVSEQLQRVVNHFHS
jgi:hypothetical protein